MMLHRFWLEFEFDKPEDAPFGVRPGCGVTARTQEEAMSLVQQRVFGGEAIPRIRKFVVDIDISTLDPGHIRPNMGNPIVPGIWFPLGY
jgi:hypothetical protein